MAVEEGIVAGGGVALINAVPAVEALLDTDDADFKTGVAIENSNILKHILSSVAKARSLNAYTGKCAAKFIEKDCLKTVSRQQ